MGATATSTVQLVSSADLPVPNTASLYDEGRPYAIGPFDKLTIDVFGIEELESREIQVDGAGQLSFPLIGTIRASGLTPTQVAEAIEQGLRNSHIRSPRVSVNLKEALSQIVTVEGEVNRPGLYPVHGRMTLLMAMATAQGLTEDAALQDVVVFRKVDGQRYAALYNLAAIRRGNYDDPPIYANDVVVVGESKARRLFRDLLQIIPVVSTPLVVALTN